MNTHKSPLLLLVACAVVLLSNQLPAQTPDLQWVTTMGDSEGDYAIAVTTDANDHVLSTGFFRGTVDFDPGPGTFNLTSNGSNDIYIQKLDNNGTLIWAKSIGSGGWDDGTAITTDQFGNVYVSGYFTTTVDFDPGAGVYDLTAGSADIFILKLDSNGDFVWARAVGSNMWDTPYSIATDTLENVYVTGYFQDTADFDPGPGTLTFISQANGWNGFIMKLNSSGNLAWANPILGNGFCVGYGVDVDDDGNCYFTGSYNNTMDFDGGPGSHLITANGNGDAFVEKLDSAGNLVWVKTMGSTSPFNGDGGRDIELDHHGHLYITGHFSDTIDFDPGPGTSNLVGNGPQDIFVWKLDTAGYFKWARGMGSPAIDWAFDLALDAGGHVFITGQFQDTADFDPGAGTYLLPSMGNYDIFVERLDSAGNFVWAGTIGSNNIDNGSSIAVDSYGAIYTAGKFMFTVDFDMGPAIQNETSAGSFDAFLFKLGSCVLTTSNVNVDACSSYTVPSGDETYTSSGTYNDTILNVLGCDSIITINLTINDSSSGINTVTACDSYAWIDGNTYTSSTTSPTWTLTNSSGCDSMVTLHLTINNSNTGTDIITACDSYTWIDGNTYTASNSTATYALTNVNGCDSVVTLNLTINTADASVSPSGITLTANTSGATYQWLTCPGMTPISGATNQSYTATANGDYAVIVTENGCSDTSACFTITGVGMLSHDWPGTITAYPNPTSGEVSIDLGALYEGIVLNVYDAIGQLVMTEQFASINRVAFNLEGSPGIYIVVIQAEGRTGFIRLLKE